MEGSSHRAWGVVEPSADGRFSGDGDEEEEEEDGCLEPAGEAGGAVGGRGAAGLRAPLPASSAFCHQRHLALGPGCVLAVIACPFKFWDLSLTGAEVCLHRLFQLPCSPGPSLLRGGREGETPAQWV